jgi:hypothetical protein
VHHRRFFAPVAAARQRREGSPIDADMIAIEISATL